MIKALVTVILVVHLSCQHVAGYRSRHDDSEIMSRVDGVDEKMDAVMRNGRVGIENLSERRHGFDNAIGFILTEETISNGDVGRSRPKRSSSRSCRRACKLKHCRGRFCLWCKRSHKCVQRHRVFATRLEPGSFGPHVPPSTNQ